MDAVELLARESEFKRLNKQLEKKTESLMKEIELSMQKQDIFTEFSPSLTLTSENNYKKHCCTPPKKEEIETPLKTFKSKKKYDHKLSPKSLDSDIHLNNRNDNNYKVKCECCIHPTDNNNEFLYAFVSVSVKDNVLPASFGKEKVTVESVCKFLSSKIKLMHEQINKLQSVINRKTSQCEGHMTQLAELESERMSLLNKTNNMKSSTADMRAKYMVLQKKYDEKEKLYKDQRSETDRLTSEIKKVLSKTVNLEARCASQEQVIETLRQQLEIFKKSEKEFRDSSRQLSSSHESAISRLESRIKSLNSRVDKQNALINNLRKQNLLLSTDGAVKNLEKEYCEFLKQDF